MVTRPSGANKRASSSGRTRLTYPTASEAGVPREASSSGPAVVPWGLRDVGVALVIIVAVVVLILGAAVAPVWAAFGEDSTVGNLASALSTVVAEVIAAVTIYRFILRPRGIDGWLLGLRRPLLDRSSGRRGFSWTWLARVVGACFLAIAILVVYVEIVTASGVGFLEPPEEQIPSELFSHWLVIVALGAAVLMAAPVFEELFFRGFVFPALDKSLGFLPAAVGSGLLFSLAHFDIGFVVPFGGIGVLFAYLYRRTESLYTSMLGHFLFNLVSFVALVARET